MDPVVAVVDGAFAFVSEHLVGIGDLGETGGCVWVCSVAVWVVPEGEGVELSLLSLVLLDSILGI